MHPRSARLHGPHYLSHMIESSEHNIKIFGEDIIDKVAVDQLKNCVGEQDYGVLTADAHVGYGHPIGGAVAYRDKISLSGVGFDIACGNKAVRTDIHYKDLDITKIMDEVIGSISFGMGRVNAEKVDHPVLDKVRKLNIRTSRSHKEKLVQKARAQLGTVGAGNHFVDLLKDEAGLVWIAVHFGSRGFGHNITTGFISVSQGGRFEDPARDKGMFSPPILFEADSETGLDYLQCLEVAGEYAYAGRDWVVDRVLRILDRPNVTFEVHNHHNFAWRETHFGDDYWVVRKGCTPAFPGQLGFIGANMFDRSYVVAGRDCAQSRAGLRSTVHGAGRVMSRRKALGKTKWSRDAGGRRTRKVVRRGLVNFAETQRKATAKGIVLRGGGADESPECYKRLEDVLMFQGDTIDILHGLTPIGVAMAGEDVVDPYRD